VQIYVVINKLTSGQRAGNRKTVSVQLGRRKDFWMSTSRWET